MPVGLAKGLFPYKTINTRFGFHYCLQSRRTDYEIVHPLALLVIDDRKIDPIPIHQFQTLGPQDNVLT